MDDDVALRKLSEGAVGQVESTEATQVLPMPSELNTIFRGPGDGNKHVGSITRPMSSQRCCSGLSKTGSVRESTKVDSEFLANDHDPYAERDPGAELHERDVTDDSKAIRNLIERPHWRRVWIIQGIIYANRLTVWCGSQRVEWPVRARLLCGASGAPRRRMFGNGTSSPWDKFDDLGGGEYLSPGVLRDDLQDDDGAEEQRSDNHLTLMSPAPRQVGKSRVKGVSTRWPWLSTKTRGTEKNTPKHGMRIGDKRRRTDLRKRHSRLHRSPSAYSGITPTQPSDFDQSDTEHTFWKERKSCSVSGTATAPEVSGSHLSVHPSATSHDKLSSEAGPLLGDTSAESLSSCDENEVELSEIEEPHPLDPQRDQIVSLLLQRYISSHTESQRQLEDTDSRSNGTASATKANSGGRSQPKTSGAKQGTGQKRKRDSDSQDDGSVGDDDEASRRRRKRPKETSEESTEHQSFACPFSKKSPSKYRRCYRYELKRIRDVKQHLRRCHRRAVYCPVCSETFGTEEARDTHVRQRNCIENTGFTVEGLSEAQAQSLSGKCSTKVPPKEQWFQVFEICFPDHAHPRSPYVDRNLSEELQSFRDYASTEGPSIMLEHMQVFRDLNEQDTAFLRRVLSDGLERIADRWSQGLDSESTPELETTSSTATVPQSSPLGSSASQSRPLHASGPARDLQGGVALASSVGNMQEQLLGISSGDKGQQGVEATQVDGIYDFGAELFDFSMLSTGAPVATAPGEVEYPLDVWALRYGPNVELTT